MSEEELIQLQMKVLRILIESNDEEVSDEELRALVIEANKKLQTS